MIKIAFIIDTIGAPTAGTEKQLLMLINGLDRSRFQPYLCVLRTSSWLEHEFHDCELLHIGFTSFASPLSYLNLLKYISWLKRQKIDIVQTHFVDGNKVGSFAARCAGVKVLISTRRNQGYWHNRLEAFLLQFLNRWATYFLCNSESTREWVARVENIHLERLKVIHNALEIDTFYQGNDEQRLSFREGLGFPPESIIVGIVANLRPVKAIDVFIRSAKNTSDSCPDVRFVLVGDGPEKDSLRTLCDELGIASKVRFLGERRDVPDILACIDIGVLTSKSESFSNAIIEYMAASLAVICSDVGGAREVVVTDVNGYIYEPEKIEDLTEYLVNIAKSKSHKRLGQNGRVQVVNMFLKKNIINKYQKLYEALV